MIVDQLGEEPDRGAGAAGALPDLSGEPEKTVGAAAASARAAVEFCGVTKRFGEVVACQDVDLKLYGGQIHGLLGENGAGKSTLMKMLIGLLTPDVGSILINGSQQTIPDPQTAAQLGIGMVHQNFSLIGALTVWENVALGESKRLDPSDTRARIAEISKRYGLTVDPDKRVGALSVGMRQRVEVVKCLIRNPKIVIFDEPTSALTNDESTQLFESLRLVVGGESRAVVLVSHKLDEVLRTSDNITIMRRSRIVEQVPTNEANVNSLTSAMVGKAPLNKDELEIGAKAPPAMVDNAPPDSKAAPDGKTPPAMVGEAPSYSEAVPDSETGERPKTRTRSVLCIEDATALGTDGTPSLSNLSLEVWAGEIVGVAGEEGSTQDALVDVLSGHLALESGSVKVNGKVVPTGKAGAMARAGIGVVAADSKAYGVVGEMTVAENFALVDQSLAFRRGIVNQSRLAAHSQRLISQYNIACEGPDAPMHTLSGGNQQRVVLARELSAMPRVLVAAQPTRGLDIAGVAYVKERLRQAAAEGVAVLVISNEQEELLELSDRIVLSDRIELADRIEQGLEP